MLNYQSKNRVGNRALSADWMGCCQLDEGFTAILFPHSLHIFSVRLLKKGVAFFMNKKISARVIALMGVLIALQIILTRYLVIPSEFFRVSFNFIPTILMGLLFGPFLGAVGNGLADLFGFFLRPIGLFFPGYTVTAIITGFLYGVFFYKKKITLSRNILANVVTTLIETGLNTFWLYVTVGKTAMIAYLPMRLGTAVAMLVAKIVIVQLLSNRTSMKRLLKINKMK